MARLAVLVGALCALALGIATTAVSAQRSLECQMVWPGPSENNDFITCLSDSDRIKSQWRYYIFPGIAALVFIFTLLGLPIVFCCKCCPCCKGCVKPKASTDRGIARCGLWMWITISVLLACGVCILLVYGMIFMTQTASTVLDDARDKTLAYFDTTRTNITLLLTDYSTNPPTPPTIDLSAFDTVDSTISSNLRTAREDYFKYVRIAEIVVCCVGGVGVLLMLCLLAFACCRCTGCCPFTFSCLYFFLALVFSLLAVIFTLIIYAMFAGCGEVQLHYQREPGVFQWYLVPQCESTFDFTALRAQVQAEEKTASQSACAKLLNYCDNSPAYPGGDQNHIFICGKGITASTQCNTLDDVVDVIQATYVKPILTNTLCVNQAGMQFLQKCTIEECSERCVDYTTPNLPARTYSKQIIQASHFATNVSTALSYVLPLLECNFIIDKVASTVETPNYGGSFREDSSDTHSCSALRTASVMLGAGLFAGSLMFILGIYVLHRGTWIWRQEKGVDTPRKR